MNKLTEKLIGTTFLIGSLFFYGNGLIDISKSKPYSENPAVQKRIELKKVIKNSISQKDYTENKKEYNDYISNTQIQKELEKSEIPTMSSLGIVSSLVGFYLAFAFLHDPKD